MPHGMPGWRSPLAPGVAGLFERRAQLGRLLRADLLGEPAKCRHPVVARGKRLAHQGRGVVVAAHRGTVPVGAAVLLPGEPALAVQDLGHGLHRLSLIHISEPTRLGMISYAVFCLKKKKKKNKTTSKNISKQK